VVVLAACTDAPTAVSPKDIARPSLQALTSTKSTDVVNVKVPFDLEVFVPCAAGGAGEDVELSGFRHVLLRSTVSKSGSIEEKLHVQLEGLSGVGSATGDKYQGTGVTQYEITLHNPLPITETFTSDLHIIGQGPGNNFRLHETFHFTINANGEVTASVDHVRVDCK
jgi:hypothetical protein